ncbi:MAG: hypothetical protein COB67_11180 [SAR324 cluster bacterium]|uniref:YbbR-like domain-containing protein n=1 Tax=SAR324 cluster bacterium TaxID=2024889 RepID=A0A2A4SW58_9DELT|nr:MAG: hypothetical protein COB67_11180 [SAR324 cluster bacterium]
MILSMKNLFFKNPVQKLLAISFALIIWTLAPEMKKGDLTEVQFFVPVSYVNLPKDFEITSPPVQSLSISVEFSEKEIDNIHPSLFQVILDLEKANAGDINYKISPKNIKSPAGVRIVKISPDSVDLTLEQTIERTLPIRPVFIGEPAEGYVLKKVTMIPNAVKVRGPHSILDNIEQLETRAINIETADSDIDMLVHVLFPKRVTPIAPKPEFYSARITLGSQPINLRFLNIPVGLINQVYVTRINPKVFNIVIRGPQSLLADFSKKDIQAFIDLQDYKPGNYKTSTPTIRLSPEIQIQKIWPPIDIWVLNQKIYE